MGLDEMKKGERGKIIGLQCSGETQRRLLEMGILPSTSFSCIRWAPFRGAVLIGLRGYELALGRREASAILVEKDGEDYGEGWVDWQPQQWKKHVI